MKCALIMAGGRGTRFWPLSTTEKPKQFLNLLGERTMLQLTVDRISTYIPIEQIFICTSSMYKNIVQEQLPELPNKNIIIEPEGRNTAPCILLSCLYINNIYPNSTVAVLPSDHMINKEKAYITILEFAMKYLESNNSIITLGIKPDRPETGYGYIKAKNKKSLFNNFEYYEVDQFREKPDLKTAKKYVESGEYYWNAGMFLFNIDYMIKQFKQHFNSCYETLSKLPSIFDQTYSEKLDDLYKKCEAISIDYAIMEKSNDLLVIPCNFGWDDIGTWGSLERYLEKNKSGNICKNDAIVVDGNNNIVLSTNKKIVLFEVDDLMVVESEEMMIVTKKESMHKLVDLRGKYDKL